VVISFLLQTYIFGVDPKVFHLTSVILHLANTLLMAAIALRLAPTLAPKRNPAILAGITGLLYGLHPALIEPVSFLSSRFDLLLTFFLLLALWADVSLKRTWLRASAVSIAFLFGALCKEMALGFVLALPLFHLALEPRAILPVREYLRSIRRRGDLYVYIGIFLAGLVYLALRVTAMGYILLPTDKQAPIHLSALTHLLLVAYSLAKYLQLTYLPFGHIAPAHPLPTPFDASNPALWIALAAVTLVVALNAFLIHRRISGAYLFAAAMLSLFPISNVIPLWRPLGAYFAESYLVFPMTLFVLATVFLLAEAYRAILAAGPQTVQRGAVVILVIWFGASLATIRQTVPLWNSDLSLWEWGAHEEPASTLAADNLALAYLAARQYPAALGASIRILHLPGAGKMDKAISDYIFAVLAFNAHDVKTAIRFATKAAKHGPALSEIPTILAHYLNVDGQYRAAAAQARATLKRLPRSFAHTELGIALIGLGKYKEAIRELRLGASIETDPTRKRLAERNLKIAQEALNKESRGIKPHIKPSI
jgi:hypothetical protein